LVLGIGALVATIALGSTLAASINLNSGAPVEFGQGVTQATACDSEISVTPFSNFENATGAGTYKFTSLKIGGIDSSADKCAGKTFVIKAYGDSGQLDLFKLETSSTNEETNTVEWTEVDRYNSIEIRKDADEFTWISGGTDDDDVISEITDITQTSFTLLFTSVVPETRRTPLASAEVVKRITIESKDSTLEVGNSGPGDGIVFYYSAAGFSCGPTLSSTCHYLEVAPDGWSGSQSDPAQSWSLNYLNATGQELNLTGSSQSGFGGEADNWFIGKGMSNSILIATQPGHGNALENAAIRALEYAGTDSRAGQWYLPAMNELNELCKYGNSQTTGDLTQECTSGTLRLDFLEGGYWTSSESLWDPPGVRAMGLLIGNQSNLLKWTSETNEYLTRRVRPIRAF